MFFHNDKRFVAPTGRDFDPDVWREFTGLPEEEAIAKLALHIHEIHSRIRLDSEKTYRFLPRDRGQRVLSMLSLFNYFFCEIMLGAAAGRGDQFQHIGQILFGKLVGVKMSSEMTPDEAISSFVDSIRFPMYELMSGDDERFLGETEGLREAVFFHGHAGQIFQVWYDVWQDVSLRGLTPNKENLLEYPQSSHAWAPLLAGHRTDRRAMTAVFDEMNMWEKIPVNVKRRYAKPVISFKGGFATFRKSNEVPEKPPFQFFISNRLAMEVSPPALRTVLPKHGGITIEEMVRCWEAISSVASIFSENFQKKILDAGDDGEILPTECILCFDRLQLIKDIGQYTDISQGRVSSVVDAMTYVDGKLQSLWGRPLFRIGNGALCVLLAPLVIGRLNYPLKDWVNSGGGNLTKKGFAFEKFLYDEVSEEIKKSWLLSRWMPFNGAKLKVVGGKEQVDLLLVTGSRIILIEAKNYMPSYEPHEVVRYLSDVEDAALQAIRKVKRVSDSRSGLKEFFKARNVNVSFDIDRCEILPLVVMYGPLGVGIERWPCPVVDLVTILKFLGNENPGVSGFVNGEVEVVEAGLPIFRSEKEADDLFYSYMRRPPIMEDYKSRIKEKVIPLFDDVEKISIYSLSYFEIGLDPRELEGL